MRDDRSIYEARNGQLVSFSGILRSKLAFVGQSPSRWSPTPMFSSSGAARWIRRALGGDRPQEVALCANLFERPGDLQRKAAWSPARREALLELLSGRSVVGLGHVVLARLQGVERTDVPHFEPVAVGDCVVATMPHPSGKNRELNDPELHARCEAFLREALRERTR